MDMRTAEGEKEGSVGGGGRRRGVDVWEREGPSLSEEWWVLVLAMREVVGGLEGSRDCGISLL